MGPGLGRGPGPSGGGDPPPGGGGVRVVVLGQPEDLQEVEEPALRCRALPERRRKRRGTPGGVGSPRRDGDAVRGTAAGPAPANPHRRAGATRTTEQEGGRAPHDSPVTTAHSGMTEGGFRSAGAPGGAVQGPPLTPPPHPGAALQPRPHAHAGRERAGDTERARMEYRRPPPGRRAGRPRHDTPPPPAPSPARQPRGPRPPPPKAGGMVPPRPRGEPECDPPPRPSRRLPWGPRRTSEPTPAHQDAAQIVPRETG